MSYEKLNYKKIGKYLVTVEEAIEPPVVVPPVVVPSSQWVGFAKDASNDLNSWTQALAKASKWKFNTVRIPVRFSTLDLTHLNKVLDLTSQAGLKAIIDYHVLASWSGFGPLWGSKACRDQWLQLATLYKGDPRVLAFELANEPTTDTLDPSIINSGNVQKGIISEYALLTDLIHMIDPSRICVWIPYWNEVDPTPWVRPHVVCTFHPYGYSGDIQTIIKQRFTEVEHRTRGLFPIWMGEIEGTPLTSISIRKAYYIEVIRQALAHGYGFNYWRYANPTDDGGLDPDEIIRLSGFA